MAGSKTKMTINKEKIPITDLSFTLKNKASSVSLTVAELTGIPQTDKILTAKVYKYMQIDKSGITNEDIDNVEFNFKITKNWLTQNGIDESQVVVARHNGDWTDLETIKVNEDQENIYYKATSPGLSFFAITPKAAEKEQVEFEEGIPAEPGIIPEVVEESGEVVKETTPEAITEEVISELEQTPIKEKAPSRIKYWILLILLVIVIIASIFFHYHHTVPHEKKHEIKLNWYKRKAEKHIKKAEHHKTKAEHYHAKAIEHHIKSIKK